MAEFRYGPVELYLVGFEGEAPSPDTLQALGDLAESGLIRVLDFVLISKSDDGDITVIEIEDEDFPLDLYEVGIAGEEDIEEFAELIEPGGSAALIALELLYARKLAESVAASGAVVLSAERIPAPIVNAVMDAAEEA
ncbi:DUF6325 family protein [Microbacterium thalassium]|uniref:Putative membrane protein n=1 Tax=Microbacterium thalassium TaxID=362649 RepID=A0A7X0FNT8_9MICO|nr:DUF6325 family protein [Microbacterium thalassium]MBB6390445.1 putative membrane protein [Microbacterium thalassium]GLK25554.1 hypothetical protein GCM10017607_28730 [Microbacterium thalassium]